MFEITSTDLLGRKGQITTQKGSIRTPCFVPVVHPDQTKNLVDVKQFSSTYDVDLIITSSYILRKKFADKKIDLHEQTNFYGPIMTDSGAYQSLVYGEIEITPESAISFQEKIHSDFGVPLDIPISIKDNYITAKDKVEITIERCKDMSKYVKGTQTNWVGPIQGGRYLDLIEKSSREISKINIFNMFAIGSVVELMSDYNYDILVDMIITAKRFLNPSKPLHLFGAGHPSMFPLIVAAGCDSFDSASYSLYAQDDRYITNTQTFQLDDLDEFPCNCPNCLSTTPQKLLEFPKNNRMVFLASHNLYVCQAEIRSIRRAITSGTLWELLESRVNAHPSLKDGFNKLMKHADELLANTPSTKKKGIFLVSKNSLMRPEIKSHQIKFENINFTNRKKLILISIIDTKLSEIYNLIRPLKAYLNKSEVMSSEFELWLLDEYFGLIPLEISEAFPLVQYIVSERISNKNMKLKLLESIRLIEKLKFDEINLIGNLNAINELVVLQRILTNTKIKGFNIHIDEKEITNIIDILDYLIKN
ncbi:MAG: tRNA guanosine(15) transglycosylase TgtA [Candidatus Thorarchaeota archaeon]